MPYYTYTHINKFLPIFPHRWWEIKFITFIESYGENIFKLAKLNYDFKLSNFHTWLCIMATEATWIPQDMMHKSSGAEQICACLVFPAPVASSDCSGQSREYHHQDQAMMGS